MNLGTGRKHVFYDVFLSRVRSKREEAIVSSEDDLYSNSKEYEECHRA